MPQGELNGRTVNAESGEPGPQGRRGNHPLPLLDGRGSAGTSPNDPLADERGGSTDAEPFRTPNGPSWRNWRPRWDGKPGFTEHGVARFKFTRASEQWRLLWMRADLKWHAYRVEGNKSRLAPLVAEVDRDPWGCFFG